jgi:hypothetical protein
MAGDDVERGSADRAGRAEEDDSPGKGRGHGRYAIQGEGLPIVSNTGH